MSFDHTRALSLLAASLAALTLSAAPAFAGEDDDDDFDDEDWPAQVQAVPQAPESFSSDSVIPRGGVATGLGGTATSGSDLLPIGGGALLLVLAGGGFAVARRGVS